MVSKKEKELEYQSIVNVAKSNMNENDDVYGKYLNNHEKNEVIKASSANAMFQIDKIESDVKKSSLLKKSFILGAIGVLPRISNYVFDLVNLQPIFNSETANQYLGTIALSGLVAVSGLMAYECAKTIKALNGIDLTNQELSDYMSRVSARIDLVKRFDENAKNNCLSGKNQDAVSELEPLEKVAIASAELRDEIKDENLLLDIAEDSCVRKFSCDLEGNVINMPNEDIGSLDDNEYYNF